MAREVNALWVPLNLDLEESKLSHETPDEPMGTKEKLWCRTPDGRVGLFKYARNRLGTEEVLGEDWAEWLVSLIGQLMGLSVAQVIPAMMSNEGVARRGIVSMRFVDPAVGRLVHGNELLAESVPGYESSISRRNPLYTIESVQAALAGVQPNPSFEIKEVHNGFTLWAAYLLLDALVSGNDRHHENWGVIRTDSGTLLAPSFDHGNALGFSASLE